MDSDGHRSLLTMERANLPSCSSDIPVLASARQPRVAYPYPRKARQRSPRQRSSYDTLQQPPTTVSPNNPCTWPTRFLYPSVDILYGLDPLPRPYWQWNATWIHWQLAQHDAYDWYQQQQIAAGSLIHCPLTQHYACHGYQPQQRAARSLRAQSPTRQRGQRRYVVYSMDRLLLLTHLFVSHRLRDPHEYDT